MWTLTHRPVALAAAVLLAAALVIPLSPPAPSSAQPGAGPRAPLVRLPFPQDDGSLTPYTFEVGYALVTLIYDTLLWRDAEGVPRPWLARSVEASADGLRLTIRLHEGVRWHDGMPLTADDVAFTFAFVAAHPHPRFTPQLQAVERVEGPDPATVVVSLRHPSPGFVDQPLADLPILPAHLWRALPPGGQPAPLGLPVGSGPYRLVSHRPGQGYRLEANPGYFRGAPAVTALEVPVIDDPEATLRALERRQVDMVPASLGGDAASQLEGLGTRLVRGPSYLGTVLVLNLRRPPFDRPEARRALAAALDLTRIARAAGSAVPADRGVLHPASAWSPGEVLHRFATGAVPRLADLGLAPIEVQVPDNDPVKLEAGRQVALALRRAGLPADVRPTSVGALARALGEDGSPPSFTAAIWTTPALASYDPDLLARLFGSNAPAGANPSGYRSAAFDEVAARVASTADPAARREAVATELRLLATDLPVVPLFFAEGIYAYRPAVYDGWVFVKGTGIFDKRSLVEPRPMPPRPPRGVADERDRRDLPLVPITAGLLAVATLAAALVGAASRRSRRGRG